MNLFQHQPSVRLAPRFMSVERAASICGGAMLVLVLGTFVSLLPSGQWHFDKYGNIADIRDNGDVVSRPGLSELESSPLLGIDPFRLR